MFIATTVEGAHRVPLGGQNLKDIAVTLMPRPVDINPTPPSLIWDYKGIGSQSGVEDVDTTVLHQPNTSPLKEAMELSLVEEAIRGEIDVIATHIVQEVADITMHKGQEVAHTTVHIGHEVADTLMQPSQPEVTNTAIHICQQVADTTMDTNEQVVDAPIIHVGEQTADTARHIGE
jgi:hypothetical protein